MLHQPFSATSLKSARPDIQIQEGQAALARGDYVAAEQSFALALGMLPRSLDALRGLGYARFQLNQLSGALEVLQTALAIAPNDMLSHHIFGRLCLRLKEPATAIKHFKRILKKIPTNEAARAGLADAHVALGQMVDAQKIVRQMLALNDRSQVALLTAARIHEWTGQHEEERRCFDKLVALAPTDKVLAYERSFTLLRLGTFTEGWSCYENRIACGVTRMPQSSAPIWRGETIEHLMVVAEQGFGDVLQFTRFLPLLQAHAKRVTLACHAPLMSLVGRSTCVDVVSLEPSEWPDHDAHVLLMSLPHVLRLDVHTVAPVAPYIVADVQRTEAWRARLTIGHRRRIAVIHSSASPHPTEENSYTRRSCPLDTLAALNTLPDTAFFDLQVGRRQAVLADWIDLGTQVSDFDDSAAVMANMDAVVTVDTSAVHLAGALGRPTFLLLPYCATWRWMTDAHHTPWYSSVRLYRQRSPGDWSHPIANVIRDLAAGDIPGAQN